MAIQGKTALGNANCPEGDSRALLSAIAAPGNEREANLIPTLANGAWRSGGTSGGKEEEQKKLSNPITLSLPLTTLMCLQILLGNGWD